ncbi:signal peptidase II [Blochmannia endosymbiont of Camponotus sp.]|uniref:signal peptidase II n=1 Tax=Blochmannia endosymbiont of Camponotus sp. TaxID=700220 RepID=UPI0020247F61|nr:signal peptidase II [Blochmannia endosymbiont of Camponotus sp.]URJ24041.1 signal peptidase II [Blochmannia endosymbiont of Camponotus sp.]
MNKKYNYKNLKWLWLSILIMLLDIGTKYWVKTHFWIGEVLSVLPGVNCYYVCNPGLAFGLFTNVNLYYRWIFVWIIILVIAMFIVALYKLIERPKCYSISYSMVIGGALGNLLDRILYGTVVDFIDVHIKNWHWPTFNVADIAICIGISILTIRCYYDLIKNNLY